MRCGACVRDAHLVFALRARGHRVRVVPLYTPLTADADLGAEPGVRMGAIGISLRQMLPFAARLPAWVTRPFASRAVLGLVSRLGIETEASSLGPLTEAMCAGSDGPMRAEIAALVTSLRAAPRPDAIHLGNSLLAGLAPALRDGLGVPVVCALQGEDAFIAALPEPWRGRAIAHLRRAATAVARFIAPSAANAAVMAPLLGVDAVRIAVLRPGVPAAAEPRPDPGVPRIGYLSIIHPRKGIDLLAAAVVRLVRDGVDLELAIAGQVRQRRCWDAVRRTLDAGGVRWTYHGEPDGAGKVAFLRSCRLFVLPTRLDEARAMAALEALAEGVPVVLPRRGVCAEIVASTGGGVVVDGDTPEAWAAAITGLLTEPAAAACGHAGWRNITGHWSPVALAAGMERVVEEVG